MYEDIDEVISVLAAFTLDKLHPIQPYRFKWKGRTFNIVKYGYSRRSRQGDTVIHTIGCLDDSGNFYELKIDSKTLVWRLERISDGQVH